MAQKRNLTIDKGSDFKASITIFDLENNQIDLAEYDIYGQIRRKYTSEDVVAAFTTEKVSNTETGIFTIALDAETTASINAGSYVYDIKIKDTENTFRVLEGTLTVTPRVTILPDD